MVNKVALSGFSSHLFLAQHDVVREGGHCPWNEDTDYLNTVTVLCSVKQPQPS